MHGPDDPPTQRIPPVPPDAAADETTVVPAFPSSAGAAGYPASPGWEQRPAYGAEETGVFGTGPVPGLVDEGRSSPGVHRQDGPARPWVWLAGVLVAALLAVGGLVWMIGAALGGDRPPVAAPPATRSATASPTPSPTPEPTPEETVPPTTEPPVTTAPPPPTATRVVPTPRRTPPRTTEAPVFVQVPNVVGDRVRGAARELEAAGLQVSVVGSDRDNARVLAQSPARGQVRRGSTVVLFAAGGRGDG